MNDSLFGNFITKTFSEIFPSVDVFIQKYKGIGIPMTISEMNAQTLYYLLYAQYGNSNIKSTDENRFIYNLFSIVFAKGRIWEKRVEMLERMSNLSEEEIRESFKGIYNKAFNPGDTGYSPNKTDELDYINDQTVNKNISGLIDSFNRLNQNLKDGTSAFIGEFKKLFITFVIPRKPLWYITEIGDEEDE